MASHCSALAWRMLGQGSLAVSQSRTRLSDQTATGVGRGGGRPSVRSLDALLGGISFY